MKSCSGLIMSYDAEVDLRFFIRDFIRTSGGVVEDLGRRMDAVLPEELAAELMAPEFLNLQFFSGEENGNNISYGSPLLERMVGIARSRIPVAGCVLRFDYLKSAGFDRLIQELFHFGNSVGKVGETAKTFCDYILLHCSYLAQSDEQKEGLITVVYNRGTRVEVPAMADGLAGTDMVFKDEAVPVGLGKAEIEKYKKLVRNSAASYLASRLKDFEASMNRRYRRDVGNLHEYYDALQREMEKNLQRSGLSERLIADRREKIRLIPAELANKVDDLYKKYSIRIKLKLGGVILLKVPVVKIFFQVLVGRKKKDITLIYNPVIKTVEPLQCHKCGNSTYQPIFNENLQLFCPQCN